MKGGTPKCFKHCAASIHPLLCCIRHERASWLQFRRIADEGFDGIANELSKCWDVDGIVFCEFKRPPWRLSYFVLHERRILLVHAFLKKGHKQPKDYRKAVKLLRKFEEHEEWKDKYE